MVGIDSDRQIPADRSIYVGEYANFNLVMYPVDYECVESDFSCDTAGVTLSLLEGYTNVLQIDVADTVTPGTEVNVFFGAQKIMHVSVVDVPVRVSEVMMENEWQPAPQEQESAEFEEQREFFIRLDKDYEPELSDFTSDNDMIEVVNIAKVQDFYRVTYLYYNSSQSTQSFNANIAFKGQEIAKITLKPTQISTALVYLGSEYNLTDIAVGPRRDFPSLDNSYMSVRVESIDEGDVDIVSAASVDGTITFNLPSWAGSGAKLIAVNAVNSEDKNSIRFTLTGTEVNITVSVSTWIKDNKPFIPGIY